LAGRLAVHTSAGLDEVVKEIRLAVDNSERKRQLTVLTSASQRMLGLDETFAERRNSAKLLQSEQGVSFVMHGLQSLWDNVEATLSALEQRSSVLKFKFKRSDGDAFTVTALFGLGLHIYLGSIYMNSASSACLTTAVSRQTDRWGEKFDRVAEHEFTPAFRSGSTLVWKSKPEDRTYSNDELAAYVIDMLRSEIESCGANVDWR
jgi:hypothetical protein